MKEKKVYHYDSDGQSGVFTLSEGVVTKFFSQQDRRYGFARMKNGKSVFFHLNNAELMEPFGVETLQWIPRFYTYSSSDRRIEDPKQGDQLVFLIRHEKKGESAGVWSTLNEYEQAFQRCEEHVQHEKVRIRENPYYRAYLKGKARHIQDTLEAITKLSADPRLIFERFERETLTGGWEPCEGPCKTTVS